ncbi:MAG: hypothetical protein A3F46_08045 [Legionellales bacterium RIFCSPHIGHO2_12_FULL_42_9]|nr:MAG: hypothetical protein A3F46_08045 [Legionellales bacterium RIFCSPHIGHO2_12_FULL_42_9]
MQQGPSQETLDKHFEQLRQFDEVQKLKNKHVKLLELIISGSDDAYLIRRCKKLLVDLGEIYERFLRKFSHAGLDPIIIGRPILFDGRSNLELDIENKTFENNLANWTSKINSIEKAEKEYCDVIMRNIKYRIISIKDYHKEILNISNAVPIQESEKISQDLNWYLTQATSYYADNNIEALNDIMNTLSRVNQIQAAIRDRISHLEQASHGLFGDQGRHKKIGRIREAVSSSGITDILESTNHPYSRNIAVDNTILYKFDGIQGRFLGKPYFPSGIPFIKTRNFSPDNEEHIQALNNMLPEHREKLEPVGNAIRQAISLHRHKLHFGDADSLTEFNLRTK